MLASCAPAASGADAKDHGRALYDRYCALCHGAAGEGYAADHASQLRNPSFLQTASTEFLRVAIEQGRPGTPMAAFGRAHGGPLTSSDTAQLIAYLRSLDRGASIDVHARAVEGDATRGLALFATHCAACHGEDGGGKTALSLNNPTFLATASDGFVRHAIAGGRPGTPMPAFSPTLSDQQIDDLVRAIRGWARPVELPAVGPVARPGLKNLVLNPRGAPAKFTLREGRFVAASDVLGALKAKARLILLDARPLSDWHRGHIPGAIPAPFHDELDDLAAAIPRDGTWVVAYCACPHAASGRVVDELRRRGFRHTAVLDEGVKVWEERGYPMQSGSPPP